MNIGYELTNKVLSEGNLQPLLDAGFNKTWLDGTGTGSNVIFTGIDQQVFRWILKHWNRHKKVPNISLFREHYPESVYPLSSSPSSLDELIDLAVEKINSFLIAELIGKTIDLHDLGDYDTAISLLKAESDRLSTNVKYRKSRSDNLTDGSFDVEALLNTEIERGIPFGFDAVDDEFWGFQPGMLVSVMGRQKAGKTTFTLNSAYNAWRQGYSVLFFSVEMDTEMLRQKLLCLGANVNSGRMRRGRLRDSEKERVREFNRILTAGDEDDPFFVISKKKSLITVDDIREEISLYNPNVVFIDGFDFMLDKHTNKTTRDWLANEHVAYDLKSLSLGNNPVGEELVVVANTQVQEKQYRPKFGIEASTISNGTGLLKASDLVIGVNKDDKNYRTINCVFSRFEYFEDVVVDINWDTMEFFVLNDRRKLENKGI